MRIDGTLTKWNDERGFGFIAPTHGGPEVFAHISAFPRDGRRARVGETLSFEIEADEKGRKRARAIQRPDRPQRTAPPARRPAPRPRRRKAQGLLGRALPLAALLGLGAYGYSHYASHHQVPFFRAAGETEPGATASDVPEFRCDGRTHCSQMTSCAEAEYFLRHCPGVQMDGDGDGVPCEQQWCSGRWGLLTCGGRRHRPRPHSSGRVDTIA